MDNISVDEIVAQVLATRLVVKMCDIGPVIEIRLLRRGWYRLALTGVAVAISWYGAASGAAAAELDQHTTMKMDEPMSGGMMKKGMKKGDVKQYAEKWDRKMKDMMEKEQKTTAPDRPKK